MTPFDTNRRATTAGRRLEIVLAQLTPDSANGRDITAQSLAELFLSACSDAQREAEAVKSSLPPVTTLEEALAVHHAMLRSPQKARLGGLAGFKMGWKNAFSEQTTLYGPLFGVGFLRVRKCTCWLCLAG